MAGIPFELIVVNDDSTDVTADIVTACARDIPEIRLIHNGLGRAVRCGLAHCDGVAVAIVMADASDSPEVVVRCCRKLKEG